MLSLHVCSSLEQLAQVGSWILKGREAAALARLRAHAFAFDLIYELLITEGRSNALGKDRRLLELWQFASHRLATANNGKQSGTPNHRPYILSWRQLCQLLIDLMKEYGLHGGNAAASDNQEEEESEDCLRYAAEWICGMMVPLNMTKVTLLDLRAFFELDLWRGGFRAGNAGAMMSRRDSLRTNSAHSSANSLPSQVLLYFNTNEYSNTIAFADSDTAVDTEASLSNSPRRGQTDASFKGAVAARPRANSL